MKIKLKELWKILMFLGLPRTNFLMKSKSL